MPTTKTQPFSVYTIMHETHCFSGFSSESSRLAHFIQLLPPLKKGFRNSRQFLFPTDTRRHRSYTIIHRGLGPRRIATDILSHLLVSHCHARYRKERSTLRMRAIWTLHHNFFDTWRRSWAAASVLLLSNVPTREDQSG